MALNVNTAIHALYGQSAFSIYASSLQQSLNTLNNSIQNSDLNPDFMNSAADVAFSQATQNEGLVYTQGTTSANRGASLVQTATTSLEQTQGILQQMSALATESAAGILSSSQLSDVQSQYNNLLSQVNTIANNTVFNGISLLQNANGSINIQVSNSSSGSKGTVSVNLLKADATSLGIASTDVNTAVDANTAITAITNALNTISSNISQLNSAQTVLQQAGAVDSNASSNLSTASSMDTTSLDSIQASVNMILNQTNAVTLAQGNANSPSALQLLTKYQNEFLATVATFLNILK